MTLIILGVLLIPVALIAAAIRHRNMHLWLPSYLLQSTRPHRPSSAPCHICLLLADHFEPFWGKAPEAIARQRVAAWLENLPRIAGLHRDSDGRPPQYSFFYPAERYEPWALESLAGICKRGFGEVEIHLHHENDTPDAFRQKLLVFKEQLRRHGLLSVDKAGNTGFGFVHGNWALNNSRPDGRKCGVNNELAILRETGCYADFTLPSAPDSTQTRKINGIYYAMGDPLRPKSHNKGVDVRAKTAGRSDVMLIQGPLCLNWRERKLGLFPRIENGEIDAVNPATPERLRLWKKCAIRVKEGPEWLFIKLHTHGCQDANLKMLLSEGLERLFSLLENDGCPLHYVSAREAYNIIRAAEAGQSGNPGDYRDWILKKRSREKC